MLDYTMCYMICVAREPTQAPASSPRQRLYMCVCKNRYDTLLHIYIYIHTQRQYIRRLPAAMRRLPCLGRFWGRCDSRETLLVHSISLSLSLSIYIYIERERCIHVYM